MAFYIVVAPHKVYVDYLNGTVLGFTTGQVFDADPALPSVSVMLRANPSPISPYTPSEAFTALPAGLPGGAATLDDTGKVPVGQLPDANALDSELAATLASMKSYTFTGVAAAGPVTLAGAGLGDTVVAVWSLDASVADAAAAFEATISVAGEIQQTAALDYSLKTFAVLLA